MNPNKRIESYKNALNKLKDILKEPETEICRDAAIKRFEFCFELGWKSIKDYLRFKGILCQSPRDCFKEAFKNGMVEDNPLWLKMIEDRNLLIHTYNEDLSREIYNRLQDYLQLFEDLQLKLMSDEDF